MPGFAELARSAAATLRGVERWLLPASCLLCGEAAAAPGAEDDPLVCRLCRLRWRRVPHPVCGRCGQPASGDAECLLCRDWPADIGRVRSAVWLDGSAREVAHRLKYDGWWRAAEAMADVMVETARCLEPLTGQVSLVPIPLGARRLRERGYNQSERIAAALGGRLGVRVRPELLVRDRETRSQTSLTPEERRANVETAFRAAGDGRGRREGGASSVEGGAVILVDDVFTTGATLLAAAAAFVSAGAARVDAVTFARAVAPVDR